VDLLFGAQKPLSELVKVTSIGISEDYGSASRSKLQVDFVAKCDPRCKDLIRITKYWRSQLSWPSGQEFYPKSYMLELICIHAFEAQQLPNKAQVNPQKMKPYILFCEVLKLMASFETLRIKFLEHYRKTAIPAVVRGQLPLILDVAYPANNLCNGFEYGILKIYATLTLAILQGPEHSAE
jgi:hypothetical protein